MTEVWADMTPEARRRSNERGRNYRARHYNAIIERDRERGRKYREENREKIRERDRTRYAKMRELAGVPVNPRGPKPREIEPPVVLPKKFGTLDKICTISS